MDSLKRLMSHRAFIALASFAVGFGTYGGLAKLSAKNNGFKASPLVSRIQPEESPFFTDPFERMNEMQENFFKGFPEISRTDATLKVQEDEHSIYYDILIPDIKEKNVQVRVENGQVILRGETEKKSQDHNQRSYFTSSFHQSYPWPSGVPADLDPTKVKIQYEDDKVRVQFPKDDSRSFT
jgi:HSP20 family molecular chaperone IbpA